MRLLINDPNILLDLEAGQLLDKLFRLPHRFLVSDILYHEQLAGHYAHLLKKGLTPVKLDSSNMVYAHALIRCTRGPSRTDCFALALAKQEHCPLLSNDTGLQQIARQEAMHSMDTLWLVEQMIEQRLINAQQANTAYELMKTKGRPLPWDKASQRLDAMRVKMVGAA